MDTVFASGEPQSPTSSRKTWVCASRNRLRFILKSHRHHRPTDCTQASQFPLDKQAGHRKGTSKQREILIADRRWFSIGCSVTIILENQSHISTTLMAPVIQKVREVFPNINPKCTVEKWPEQFLLGSHRVRFETCWSNDNTPAFFEPFKVIAHDQLRTPEMVKNMIVLPHGWTTDCRRNRLVRRQTSILQTPSCVVGHFGDVPAECIARAVGQ